MLYDFVLIVSVVLIIFAIYKGYENRIPLEEYRRKKAMKAKREWPTRKMLDNYYRTGNFRCLYDEKFKG